MPNYPYPQWRRVTFAALLIAIVSISFIPSITEGTLVVRVHGFIPGGAISHIYVKFSEVSVHTAGYPPDTGWTTIGNLLPRVDLVPQSANTVPDAIISARIQSGRYDAFKLVAANSTIIVDNAPAFQISTGPTITGNTSIPVPPNGFGDILIVLLVDYNSILATQPQLSLRLLQATGA